MVRQFNFSAGPSVLPESVLRKAAEDLVDFPGAGMSIMEMSHRSTVFMDIMARTEASFRRLLKISDNYEVLFLQGGAATQFAMVPLNLMPNHGTADYVLTGSWAVKAQKEASRYGKARIAGSSEADHFAKIPHQEDLDLNPEAAYLHITTNNTIFGTRWHYRPESGNVPLVADMSSDILSEPVDIDRFGLIYAGAQKNAGIAGLTLVIIRKDLIGKALPFTPTMLNYQTHAQAGSSYNTPPCWALYMAGLVFEWVLKQGGPAAMAERNRRKAGKLYDFLDRSSFFSATVEKPYRSLMNVPFLLADDGRNKAFLEQAAARGLLNLEGHRSVGGMRASLYNAMPEEGVDALIHFLETFEKEQA